MMKKLPVGHSDFKTVIEENLYYVDKSLFIKELIDQGTQALLIPRPRRFGMSMLRYFFEKTEEDASHLFRHLKIWQAGKEYTDRQGKYPVIYLTFKDIKESNWESALEKMQQIIQEEYERHEELFSANTLSKREKNYYERVADLEAGQGQYESALKNLSSYLARHHNQKVILLIDEYDTPIQAGYVNGYYDEIVGFMRNFLSGVLKDNVHLEKGVLTGIMRVAKESIFLGLNNLGVFTLLSNSFADKFGFTESEIRQMVRDFDIEENEQEINDCYNGYVFGDVVIYNPWSIINYLNSPADGFKPYWLNTSDNAIVVQLLTREGQELRLELESLIRNISIEKPIEENIVFAELGQRDDLLWSFLLFGGYLKYVDKRVDELDPSIILAQLKLPNLEVRGIFTRLVKNWFHTRMEHQKVQMMLHSLVKGNVKDFGRYLRDLVMNIFSYHDFGEESEKVYQAFTIGLLVWLGGQYEIKSNRESGYGRYDLMIIPHDATRVGYVIEFKKLDAYENETVEIAIQKAFEQIEEKKYAAELVSQGIQNIKKLAIVFEGKQVWVREKTDG